MSSGTRIRKGPTNFSLSTRDFSLSRPATRDGADLQTLPLRRRARVGLSPTGIRPPAQGCRTRLPWERRRASSPTPTGLRPGPTSKAPELNNRQQFEANTALIYKHCSRNEGRRQTEVCRRQTEVCRTSTTAHRPAARTLLNSFCAAVDSGLACTSSLNSRSASSTNPASA